MRGSGVGWFRLTRARPVRGLAALALTLSFASTGLVALATPANAASPPTITLRPPLATDNDRTPTWEFGDGLDSYECSFGPSGAPPPFTPCTSPFTAPSQGTDGSYELAVEVVGSTQTVTDTYTLDTVATLTVVEPTPNPGSVTAPHWTVGVETGGAAMCSLDGAAAIGCTGSFDPTGLTAGVHTLDITATDNVPGNTGSASYTYTVDLTPPGAPTVVGSSGLHNTPSVSWTWSEATGDTALCTFTSVGVAAAPVDCTGGAFSRSVSVNGDYSLSVTLTDSAGNAGPAGSGPTYSYDSTPATASTFTTSPTSPGNEQNPSWSFSTPELLVSCTLTGPAGFTPVTQTCASGSFTPPATLTLDGAYRLAVTTTTPAGSTATATSADYVLDHTGPAAPVVLSPTVAHNDPDPTWAYTGEMPTTAYCTLKGVHPTAPLTSSVGPTVCPAGLNPHLTRDGTYTVEMYLVDGLGNVGATGTSADWVYDGTAPATPVLTGVPLLGNDTTPTYGLATETGGAATCWTTSGATTVDTSSCQSGSYTPATALTDGSYVVHAVVTDAAGNASVEGTRTYDLDSLAPGAPTVTAPATPSNVRNPQWLLSSDGASTLTCRLLLGGTVVDSAGCQTSYQADLALPAADGAYSLEITATDGALNTTVVTSPYLLDTVAPASVTVTGPTSPGNAAAPQWTFTPVGGTTAECQLVQGLSTSSWTDCSLGSYVVTPIADGTYQVYVQVKDLAGNPAPLAISASYTSDRTAPSPPTVVAPTSPGNNPAPSWTWSSPETSPTATCRLDRAGVIGTAVACNSGSFAPTLTGDTSYVVVVQLFDPAGNPSTPTTTASYVLDTGVPVAPVVTGTTGTGNSSTPVWSFTSEPGAATECRLVRDGTAGAFGPCTSGAQVTLPGNGDFVYEVRQTDAAGNTSPVGQGPSYRYDGTAPATPSVTAPASPSKALKPMFTFGAEALATTECRALQATVLVQDWATCTSPVTIDLTGLPDASYTVEVRATDAAGNTSAAGTSLSYVLDTTAPDPALVSGPAGPSTDTTPTWTWSSAGSSAFCQLVHDGVTDPTVTACASPYSPPLSVDGDWVLQVSLRDTALNTGAPGASGVYVLDTTAPAAPLVTAPPSPGRVSRPSWSVTAEAGATAQCQLANGSGTVLSAYAACTLPVTTDLSARQDGTYVLSVIITDEVGLTGPAGSATYRLDTTAPAAPVFTPPVPTTGKSATASFPFTVEAGTSVTCVLSSGATTISTDTSCTSPIPLTLGTLPDGTYTISATATDLAGNVGPTQTATYVYDTAAPAAPVLVTGPAPTSSDRTPTWTFTAEANATVTCRLTGSSGIVVPDTACTTGTFQPDLTAALDDGYVLTAKATDAAGNVGPALTLTYLLDATAPVTADVVAPVSPGRGTSPSWQVSATEGTVQCQLRKGTLILRPFADCPATFTPDLSTTGDGVYTFTAHVVDAAGNVSADVISRYRLDTTAPATATLITPVSPSTDRNPTWTVASPDTTVTARCQVLGPSGTVVKPFAACAVSVSGSPYSLDLTGRTDGPWTLVVRLTDAAGNQAPTDATGAYVLDTAAPNVVLVTAPASPSRLSTPTWQLVGDVDAVLECRLSTATVAGTFAPCLPTAGVPGSGSFTADLTTMPDGTYTLGVRSKDSAGNLGAESTSGYVLDHVAPATPQPPGAPVSPAKAPVISWTFSVDTDATALCTLSSATAVVAPEQPCTSPWVTDLGQYGDADYALAVRAVDAAGNTSGSVSTHYVLDRTPPAAPSIINTPGTPSPDLTPTWSIQPTDPKDTIECQLAGSATPVWASCSSPVTFDLGGATNGTYQLLVRETDAAGNVSAVTTSPDYALDLTAPAPPDVFAPDVSRSNSTAPVFHIVRQAGDVDTVSLLCTVTRFDGGSSVAAPCAFGDSTVTLTGLHGVGPVVLEVQTVDALNNISGKASATYTFDDVAPASPSLLGPDPNESFDRVVEWTFGGVVDADHFVCELRKSSQSGPLPTPTCTSPHIVTLPSFGTWTFSVWAVDQAGNRSGAPVSQTYVYLAPVPTVAAKGPTAGSDSTPTWTFSVPVGDKVECLLGLPGGQALTYDCTAPVTAARSVNLVSGAALLGPSQPSATRGSSFTANLDGRPAGTYTLALRLTDAFGNVGDYGPRASYRYAPVVVGSNHLGGSPSTPSTPSGTGSPSTPTEIPTGPTTGSGSPTGAGPGTATPSGTSDVTPPTKGRKPVSLGRIQPRDVIPSFGAVPRVIKDTLADSIKKPTIPLLLLVVVVGFLLLQNQIDRRDPKLASAPVGAEPELDFGPVRGRGSSGPRELGGGAPA